MYSIPFLGFLKWIDKSRNQITLKLTKEEGEDLPQNIFPPMDLYAPNRSQDIKT